MAQSTAQQGSAKGNPAPYGSDADTLPLGNLLVGVTLCVKRHALNGNGHPAASSQGGDDTVHRGELVAIHVGNRYVGFVGAIHRHTHSAPVLRLEGVGHNGKEPRLEIPSALEFPVIEKAFQYCLGCKVFRILAIVIELSCFVFYPRVMIDYKLVYIHGVYGLGFRYLRA